MCEYAGAMEESDNMDFNKDAVDSTTSCPASLAGTEEDNPDHCPSLEDLADPESCLPFVVEPEESELGAASTAHDADIQSTRARRRRRHVKSSKKKDDDDGCYDEDPDDDNELNTDGRRKRSAVQEVFKFVHYAEGPGGEYLCRYPGCRYTDTFRSLTNCKNHQLAQHATDAEKVFACDDCGERFASRRLHTKHVNMAHNMRFACEVCGRKFSERTRLRIHSRVHTGEKPFVCEQCGYSCSQRDNLKKHKGGPSQPAGSNKYFISS